MKVRDEEVTKSHLWHKEAKNKSILQKIDSKTSVMPSCYDNPPVVAVVVKTRGCLSPYVVFLLLVMANLCVVTAEEPNILHMLKDMFGGENKNLQFEVKGGHIKVMAITATDADIIIRTRTNDKDWIVYSLVILMTAACISVSIIFGCRRSKKSTETVEPRTCQAQDNTKETAATPQDSEASSGSKESPRTYLKALRDSVPENSASVAEGRTCSRRTYLFFGFRNMLFFLLPTIGIVLLLVGWTTQDARCKF
ncbi:uncharacterized protein LOC131931397 [Physella acuta]|uniref:uncharacterized protein LOC131931397 n=1 Tax=Physella acuta TaxID=109671 RepID=UPI0027DC5771|nr:uncharacterized protein LOC131931397 [Physella acuta]